MKNEKNFIEDDFDLEVFMKKQKETNFKKLNDKNKMILNFISFVMLIVSLLISFILYMLISYYIDLYISKRSAVKSQNIINSIGKEDNYSFLELDEYEINESIKKLRIEFGNEDIVGYLSIDGTSINYPVAQTINNEFYLNRDIYKKNNSSGAIFLDYANDLFDLGYNTVIYGHNMRNNIMFNNLRYYVNEKYFRTNNFIKFITPYNETLWEVFSFYPTSTDFNYIQTDFDNEDDFYNLVQLFKNKSLFETDVMVTKDDKIITLSTCTNRCLDERFALHAKLISYI